MLSVKFLWLGNSAWDFFFFLGGGGIKFWCRDFLAVLFESQGIFLGFDFCPHSIIPVTWSLEIQIKSIYIRLFKTPNKTLSCQVQFHSFPA